MLVFTRRRDEAIMIGEGIEVRVLRVGKDGVRLGIIAPTEVRVHRREIYDQIRDANQSAVVKPDRLAAVAERLKSTNHQPPTTNHQPPTTNRESDSL